MQQGRNEIESHDLLNLRNEPKFITHLEQKQQIVLSTQIWKYNHDGKCQSRILVVTNMAILNIIKTENIIKSIMKKLINFQNNFTLKRRISLKNLYGITLASNRQSNTFLIHVINQHDYHYRAENNKMILLKCISEQYKKVTKKLLPFYFKDQQMILNYCTSKYHLKQKKDVKPKQNAHYLTDQYFQQQQFEDKDYICEYSLSKSKIKPNDFKLIEINHLKSGQSYYILRQYQRDSINMQNLYKSSMLLNPSFIFSSQNKKLTYIPFIIGGNLKEYIRKYIPISKPDLIFYISQIINFLDNIHLDNMLFRDLVLENIFVKQNGYLIFNGLKRSIISYNKQQLYYEIRGNPRYFPPQVITCQGFNKELDVWKLGICAYFLCQGSLPFDGASLKDLYYNILTKQIDSPSIPSFVLKMLSKDRKQRITIQELKKHPDFTSINWQSIQNQQVKAPHTPSVGTRTGKLPKIYHLTANQQDNSS